VNIHASILRRPTDIPADRESRWVCDRYVGPDASLLLRASSGCTCCDQIRNMLISAAQASYPATEQAIWCAMHNQTDAI
jgi:hypothetical protein